MDKIQIGWMLPEDLHRRYNSIMRDIEAGDHQTKVEIGVGDGGEIQIKVSDEAGWMTFGEDGTCKELVLISHR